MANYLPLYSFPNEPLFNNLLRLADQTPAKQHIIHDRTLEGGDIEVDYDQLLSDIVHMRQLLYNTLPMHIFDRYGVIKKTRPYIFLLIPSNYEFVVAALSVLALGAAFVPLNTNVAPAYALELLQKCDSAIVVLGAACLAVGIDIQQYAGAAKYPIQVVQVTMLTQVNVDRSALHYNIDKDMAVSADRPSMISFSTGTTDRPKGIVHTRNLFYRLIPSRPKGTVLIFTPASWISSINLIFLPIFGGPKSEMIPTNCTPAFFWERLREGGVTTLSGYLPFWNGLAQYFRDNITTLPSEIQASYIHGLQGLRLAYLVGALPSVSFLNFWREQLHLPLQVAYGVTEVGGLVLATTPDTDPTIDCCIGRSLPQVTVKLSKQTHGEILIKTSNLMSHYLDNPTATKSVIDEDGFYKTNDAGHLVGNDIVFDGRIGCDFVDCGDRREVSVFGLEISLAQLPYLSEAYVVPAPRLGANQQFGILARFRPLDPTADSPEPNGADSVTIEDNLQSLRAELSKAAVVYRVPIALRILRNGERVPLIEGVKFSRKLAAEMFFFPSSQDFHLLEQIDVSN